MLASAPPLQQVSEPEGAKLLVVDDDPAVRLLYETVLKDVEGVASVVVASDGTEAVELARTLVFDVAVLDLHMPRLDGVGAAAVLTALQPPLRIALHSSDPDGLRERARDLDIPLFDKADLDPLVDWVAGEAKRAWLRRRGADAGRRDLSCVRCGYGIVCDEPPQRCPMCQRAANWRPGLRRRSHAAR